MLYVFSDPHFGHVNKNGEGILYYEPLRQKVLGTTIEEHDKVLLQRINFKVRPEDTLICLGDFSQMTGVRRYREQIKCDNVILILGNHDKQSVPYYYRCGFSVVCYEIVLKIAGEFVRLRHHPYRKPWYKVIFPWQYREKDRAKRPRNHGSWLLHGHTHSQRAAPKGTIMTLILAFLGIINKQINVGVDLNNYYPLAQREIESRISKAKRKRAKNKFKFKFWKSK